MWPFSKNRKNNKDVKNIEDCETLEEEEDIIEIEDSIFEFVLQDDEPVDCHKTVRALIKSRQEVYSNLKDQLEDFKTQATALMDKPIGDKNV